MTLQLTTEQRVRDWKNWTDTTRFPSSWITRAITALSARFERDLGRQMQTQAWTETLDVRPYEGQTFRLTYFPVSSITDVRHDLAREFGALTVLDSTTYTFDADRGLLDIDKSILTAGPNVLQVNYTGGFGIDAAGVAAAHPDIEDAIIQQVAFWFESRDRLGQDNVQGPDGSITVFSKMDWLPPAKAALKHWRPVVVF